MQKRRLPNRCPVCQDEMVITSLKCSQCETTIGGYFEVSGLFRLSKEQIEFVETFLRCRGNIKEVERELGISYPTVRGRLDAAIEAMGYGAAPAMQAVAQDRSRERREILDALNRGEISSQDAVRLLKAMSE